MEITNGSDLILILNIEDIKDTPIRVRDCKTFKVRVYTTNRTDCLTYTKSNVKQGGEVDKIAITAKDLERLASGVICYDYDYSVYDENFEDDMRYDKVKEVVTDFYWRNAKRTDNSNGISYDDLSRLYDRLDQEENDRMSSDYDLAQAINKVTLNYAKKSEVSVIKDADGNIINEFVVDTKFDEDNYYTKSEVDELIAESLYDDSEIKQGIEQLSESIEALESIDYATKEDLNDVTVDLSDYYKKTEVDNKIAQLASGGEINLDGYATTEDLKNYYTKEEADEKYLSLEDVVTKDELDDMLKDTPVANPDGYYTKTEADKRFAFKGEAIGGDVSLEDYYTKSEVNDLIDGIEVPQVDLSNYVTKTELKTVSDKVDNIQVTDGYDDTAIKTRLTALEAIDYSQYALKSEIPNMSNLATKSEVQTIKNKVESIDLSDYATKEEIPSLEGYAKFWSGTQAEYDAITSKDNNTIYIITE